MVCWPILRIYRQVGSRYADMHIRDNDFLIAGADKVLKHIFYIAFAFGMSLQDGSPRQQLIGTPESHLAVNNRDSGVEDRLQGEWRVTEAFVSIEGRSESISLEPHGGLLSFVFKGDEFTTRDLSKTNNHGKFFIDTGRQPMWLDAGGTKGVFRFEGDSLVIRWGLQRPKGFDFGDGLLTEKFVLTKVARDDESRNGLVGDWVLADAVGYLYKPEEKGEVSLLALKVRERSVVWINGTKSMESSISVDDTKCPMWIDFSDSRPFYDPGDIGLDIPPLPMKGIFRVDGDTLSLCLSVDGDRPSGFDVIPNRIRPIIFRRKRVVPARLPEGESQ